MDIIDRLRQEVETSSDYRQQSQLAVRMGICLARAGRCEEAIAVYEQHHGEGFGSHASLSLRVMLLDALIEYYCNKGPSRASQKLQRALVLAKSLSPPDIPIISAWLAHIQFNACEYDAMRRLLGSLTNDSLADPEVRIRVSLTLGDAYGLGGEFAEANRWYQIARLAAESAGDNLAIAAMMHNRSSLALAHCRFSLSCGKNSACDAERFLPELASAKAYETYYRATGGLYPYEVWMARTAMLSADFEGAVYLLDKSLVSGQIDMTDAIIPALEMDLAYCKFRLGLIDASASLASKALTGNLSQLHSDDRAVLMSFAVEIVEASDGAMAIDLRHQANAAAGAFLAETDVVRACVRQVVDQMHPSV